MYYGMFYGGKHRRGFWKKHGLDVLTFVGLLVVFGIPVFVLFTR